jgi:hypothetical protein
MMTKKSRAAKLELARDIESFTCGEVPSPLAMMRAPKLEHWQSYVRRRGKEFVLVVSGDVYRHPEIDDGQNIQTPAVAWFDRKDRFIRTHSRLYCLGQPAADKEGIDT